IRVRPEREAVVDVRQLRAHTKSVTRAAHGSLENRLHLQRFSDIAHTHAGLSFERVRRRTRRNPQTAQLAERVRELVCHAVAEIIVRGIASDVHEGKNSDRAQLSTVGGRRGGATLVEPVSEWSENEKRNGSDRRARKSICAQRRRKSRLR